MYHIVVLHSIVLQKLNEMESQGLIERITDPTDWVHPIVVNKKTNGDIRICMDPRALNEYIKREYFQIPNFDDLFSQLCGSQIYLLLDASSAFHQVPLDSDSSKLCTIATPFGRYRYLRMPFGISSAPEVFQRILSNALKGIPGVIVYFDILVFGANIDHNKNLESVLNKISETGLTLNKEKSNFASNEVNFLGHIIDKNGIKADESKIKTIQKMLIPKNKKELQTFLGMITYLGKFLPHLSEKTFPLRKLLSEKNEWIWDSDQDRCFQELKDLITSTPVLKYFDPSLPLILSVDASQYGLGAVIMQANHPVEFSSVSLNSTQKGYSQIEKELLAIVHGCERFNFYLYGRTFEVHTDHQPLLGLMKKTIRKYITTITKADDAFVEI